MRREFEDVDSLNEIDLVFFDELNNDMLKGNIDRNGIVLLNEYDIKKMNYIKAIQTLKAAVEEINKNDSALLRDGLIQCFEFTYELAWKTGKGYLAQEGIADKNSPRDVIKELYRSS